MKGDFSRLTFDPAKQFSRVLMQQGRVQLDADWNEQSSLLLHHLRELARALVGPHGGVGEDAFKVGKEGEGEEEGSRLVFGEGVYFVDGIMCRNDGDLAFAAPEDWPGRGEGQSHVGGHFLVYLAVAERHVTFVNDDSLRERALGDGVDTATRTKVVCVASALRADEFIDFGTDPSTGEGSEPSEEEIAEGVEAMLDFLRPDEGRPTLLALPTEEPPAPHNICTVPPFAEYRGAGNQLYRVEIHKPTTDGERPTFKWSRENGSVVFPVREAARGKRLRVERYGRDGRFSLRKGDFVEFETDDLVASGQFSDLARVESVEGDTVTLDTEPPPDFGSDQSQHPLLRRWDHAAHRADAEYEFVRGVIEIDEDEETRHPLEQGIEVKFKAGGAEYQRGDYWVIPARTAGGKLDWPAGQFLPARRAEAGIAPLALVRLDDDGQIDDDIRDLRMVIQPVTKPAGSAS